MRRYLLVALWPVGLAAIAAATVVAVRRVPPPPPSVRDPQSPTPAGAAALPQVSASVPVREAPRTGDAGHPRRGDIQGIWQAQSAECPAWVPDLIRLGAIGATGGVFSYGVMRLLGPSVVNHGLAVDEPIFRWTSSHQVDWWAAIMERFNKVGNTWTTWGAVGTAAICLGMSWDRQRWLPPAALGTAILVDHTATHALHRKIDRLGPPTNPLGTYPSGGMDRVILFYGLIAHMLWREFSGSRRGAICATGAVGALTFSQAYCREYLSQHWFIDILCGLFYGAALLVPFIAAIQMITAGDGEGAGRRSRCRAT